MKRRCVASLILLASAGAFCGLKDSTARLQRAAAADELAWQTETRRISQTRKEWEKLTITVRDTQHEFEMMRSAAASVASASAWIPGPGQDLSAAQSEKLLAELGFNWNSTGGYVVVSKDTLRRIRLDGMKNMKLSDLAAQVLSITPQERASINAMTEELNAAYKSWAQAHLQQTKPSGKVLANLTLPPDPGFSQSLSNTFGGSVVGTLGAERGGLLLNYTRSWMVDLGMESHVNPSVPTTMTITREGNGDNYYLGVSVKQGGNSMFTYASPRQPFPTAFLPLFPGGWKDLATQEGFALPRQFEQTAVQP